jgi:hypothetical protein
MAYVDMVMIRRGIIYTLFPNILVVLGLYFFIYIQIDDNESRHIYKTHTSNIV